MNIPNKLTILRILLIPFFVIFAKMGSFGMQAVAVAIYILACVTDTLDGRIARSRGLVTNFGKFMDPIADKLLVMSAMVVLTYQRRMPDWVCILMLAREFLVSGFRLVAVENGRVIAAGPLGKLKTVFQLVGTSLIFLGNPIASNFNIPLGQILVYISTLLSIWSCFEYIYKNKELLRG